MLFQSSIWLNNMLKLDDNFPRIIIAFPLNLATYPIERATFRCQQRQNVTILRSSNIQVQFNGLNMKSIASSCFAGLDNTM